MLNVITLFSGYDSQCLALNRLGLPYDLVAWAEIDKHACTAHDALFPQFKGRNVGDVSKVDWAEWHRRHPQPVDLLTYSSPCQDFSSAGLQRGGEEGSGTRSGLLWETERAVSELRPRHLVFENVGGLVSDKFIDLFQRWQVRLGGYGYTNFAQLMNAKDYGVPQNRLRIFMVSILDCQRAYYFPQPFRLERRLKDVLEQNVAERYYLKEEQVEKLISATETHKERGNGFAFKPHTPEDEYASTIAHTTGGMVSKTDNFVAEPRVEIIADIQPENKRPKSNVVRQQNMLVGVNGLSPCIPATHTQHEFKIAEPQDNVMLGWTRSNTGKGDPTYHPVSVANCVTAAKRDNTQNYVMEPSILTPVRTEYGKAIRKQYGDNNIPESRHNLTSLQPKQDGTSNTITSVAKDNLLIIPQATKEGYAVVPEGGVFDASYPDSKTRRGRVQEGGTVSPTIMASQNELLRYEGIRIRRLTERELYRLMDVDEADIDTLLAAPIPRTQHAKLAGNSIVVACLYYIFRNLFVDTEPAAGTQTKLF